MATIQEICDKLELTALTKVADASLEVKDACVCDLLSWVMAKGEADMAWITVQTHLNIIAVACLHDFACIIIPEGIAVPDETLAKAEEEDVVILSSQKTAYRICAGLAGLGI